MGEGLRGLLFDFDGTIAETERFGHRVAYNLAFAELGLDWVWNEALYGELLAVAGGKERLRYYLDAFRPDLRDDPALAGMITEIHAVKVRHFTQIAPTIPLRPGFARLVREAHSAGVAVAIVTTASKRGVEALLGQDTDLPAMIGLIAANEAVERKKPAPDAYLWALQRLGLEASRCVAIEDSSIGLAAALAAELRTVVTVSDYTGGEDFSGAAAVLSGLGEPDDPAEAISGPAPGTGIVDLAFLNAIGDTAARGQQETHPKG